MTGSNRLKQQTTEPPKQVPKLLVSVKDHREAMEAVVAGIDWLDLKNPLRGPLGPVDGRMAIEIADWLPSGIPLSAAAGELLQWLAANNRSPIVGPAELTGSAARRGPDKIKLIKLGLAGCGSRTDWPDLWHQARKIIEEAEKQLVVVAYADWRQANAPPPAEVLHYLIQERCPGQERCQYLLVDTFIKSEGNILNYLPPEELNLLLQKTHQESFQTVVAGGLSTKIFPQIAALPIDMLAIRSAACVAGRTSQISRLRIDLFKKKMAQYDWQQG